MFLDINGKMVLKSSTASMESLKNYIIRQLDNLDIETTKVENDVIHWKGPSIWWFNPIAMFRGLEGKISLNITPPGDLVVNYSVSLLLIRVILIMFSLIFVIVHFLGGMPFIMMLIMIGLIWVFMYGFTWLTTALMFRGFIERVLE